MSDLPEFVLDRVFAAPPELVWRAWTDPEILKRWYGPNVETVIHEFTLEPGDIVALHLESPQEEAQYVVETIHSLRGVAIKDNDDSRGISWSDMVVLLRSVLGEGGGGGQGHQCRGTGHKGALDHEHSSSRPLTDGRSSATLSGGRSPLCASPLRSSSSFAPP